MYEIGCFKFRGYHDLMVSDKFASRFKQWEGFIHLKSHVGHQKPHGVI